MGGNVKRWIFVGAGVIGIAAVSSGVFIKAGKPPQVKIAMNSTGLTSLMSDNVEVLDSGEFRVEQVLIRKPDGKTYPGSPYGTTLSDPGNQEITKIYPWGTVKLAYAAKDNRLTLTLATANTSDTETIQGVRFVPLTLRFPERLKE
jgi:hypothetical protein